MVNTDNKHIHSKENNEMIITKKDYLRSLICESARGYLRGFLKRAADEPQSFSHDEPQHFSEFAGEIDEHINFITAADIPWDQETTWEELIGKK